MPHLPFVLGRAGARDVCGCCGPKIAHVKFVGMLTVLVALQTPLSFLLSPLCNLLASPVGVLL